MRRRFYFQGLFPGEEPIRDVLPRWLITQGFKPEAAELLKALNESIDDPDFAIGPSYLMTRRIAEPEGLERIWKTAILPLLTEHYFGEGRDIDREFGLQALRKTLNGRSAAVLQIDADEPVPAELPDPQ
jgi:5-methylcytosine-specific restriction protein B